MYIVTNRNLQPKRTDTQRFGKSFNQDGPDELRLATADKSTGKWRVKILADSAKVGRTRKPRSEVVFRELQKRLMREKRNCVFFVHGFNNDFKAVLERGALLERNYGVEVVAFTWPADGTGGRGKLRGTTKGVLAYKSDKNDAVRSAPAFDRTLEKWAHYFQEFQRENCDQRVTLLMHSMGNYLFKTLMKSSIYQGETRIFDNVILCAADVNNDGHEEWVDRIQFRRRLYVTINEDDSALAVSRAKFGSKQKARLGHFTRNLVSRNAMYVDFSRADDVGRSHAYFEKEPHRKNPQVRSFFEQALNGEHAEDDLDEVAPGLFRVS